MLSVPNRARLAHHLGSAWLGAELRPEHCIRLPVGTLEQLLDDVRREGRAAQAGPRPGAISLTLPFPPSANSIWRAVNGRNIVSAPYRKWRRAAMDALHEQLRRWPERPVLPGLYAMTLVTDRPDMRARDLSNTIKAVEDVLTPPRKNKPGAHVVEDDSRAQQILLRWSSAAPTKAARVSVLLEPWSLGVA